MKMIIISEEAFKKLFDTLSTELELETLKSKKCNESLSSWQTQALSDLHRTFIYNIRRLQSDIEKG